MNLNAKGRLHLLLCILGAPASTSYIHAVQPWRNELVLDLDTAERWPSNSIDGLTVAEAFVLTERGYVSGACWTLDEIAVLFGIGRERVRQIEHKALSRLAASQELADLWRAPDCTNRTT